LKKPLPDRPTEAELRRSGTAARGCPSDTAAGVMLARHRRAGSSAARSAHECRSPNSPSIDCGIPRRHSWAAPTTDIVVRTLCAVTPTLSRAVGHDLVSAHVAGPPICGSGRRRLEARWGTDAELLQKSHSVATYPALTLYQPESGLAWRRGRLARSLRVGHLLAAGRWPGGGRGPEPRSVRDDGADRAAGGSLGQRCRVG
jgi:hypothetical protein